MTKGGDSLANYQIDPKKQFSKHLARWTAVFWFFYLTWLSVLMFLEPSVAMYSFYMSIVVSVVMMVSVISYTINSVQEKRIFGMLDKAQIELKFGPAKVSLGKDKDDDSDDDSDDNSDDEQEEGGNG